MNPRRGTTSSNTRCIRQDARASRSSVSVYSVTANSSERPSHNIKPGRRRHVVRGRTASFQPILILTLFIFAVLCGTSEAGILRRRSLEAGGTQVLADAEKREILVDPRSEPSAGGDRQYQVEVRQVGARISSGVPELSLMHSTTDRHDTKSTSHTNTQSTTTTSSSSSTATPSQTTNSTSGSLTIGGSSPTAIPSNFALPKPFDTSIGSNFTATSCPAFFNAFLNNATFVNCLPFSLLLENSNSFFQDTGSLSAITRVLDATCLDAVFPTCSAVMNNLALELRQDSNCGADYSLQNPIVEQAYVGLLSYGVLHDAACLKDPSGATDNYCFANAITNATSPADSYIYYLPLGRPLPGGSRPTCNACLQKTMDMFDQVAGNLTQPVSGVYTTAAQFIDAGCGPTFVNATAQPIKGSGAPHMSSSIWVAVGVSIIVGAWTAFF